MSRTTDLRARKARLEREVYAPKAAAARERMIAHGEDAESTAARHMREKKAELRTIEEKLAGKRVNMDSEKAESIKTAVIEDILDEIQNGVKTRTSDKRDRRDSVSRFRKRRDARMKARK